ncbi:N-acyl homoserine lactonase family protein [Cognatishimia activa]|uniref:N-acyl homoserine lactonase family protein n=1 Tax=Cognatishimia activa TaxID=1715691 RepID=UPI002230D631|nr:N-acyl homoserine lactonase family protein [Cognatishimia activa]UZD90440.1 N-acyl homoserine lactonase family protein [Cognatishimia activa]
MSDWEVYSVKYADRNSRTRADSFIFDDNHDAPHDMDYFIWVLRRGDKVILVDTGYDEAEARERERPIIMDPREALKPLGLQPEAITDVIVTHLHYDHAGGLHMFPNALLHMQSAEMAFATGPCMCHGTLQAPFSAGHICEAVKRLYAGKLTFYDGCAEIAEGVTVHHIGGHSRGLQCVRVKTQAGWLVLASDATHFYENFLSEKPFPIVVDLEDMLKGFATLRQLASSPKLIIPGHDPLVKQLFPQFGSDHIHRLDIGPLDEFAEIWKQDTVK